MKHPLSRRLHAYWDRRRNGRPAPGRADIVPAELGAQLVHCFLIDLTAAAPARFRFCGSSLAARYGRDLTDEDYLSLWHVADRRAWSRALAEMRRNATGIVAGVTAETVGSGFVTFEILLLPLRGAARCDSAIGCMVRVGGHEETNRIKARVTVQSLDSYIASADADSRRLTDPSPRRWATAEIGRHPRAGTATSSSSRVTGRTIGRLRDLNNATANFPRK